MRRASRAGRSVRHRAGYDKPATRTRQREHVRRPDESPDATPAAADDDISRVEPAAPWDGRRELTERFMRGWWNCCENSAGRRSIAREKVPG